jgi:O-antigen ligase
MIGMGVTGAAPRFTVSHGETRAKASPAAIALGLYVALTVGRLTDWFPSAHLALAGACLVLLMTLSLPPLGFPLLRHSGARSILAITALAVLSIPGSVWPGESASFVLTAYWKVILTFFLVVYCTRSVADARAIVGGLLGGLAVLAAATLAFETARTAGVNATYDANDVAFVMSSGMPLALLPALSDRSVARRVAAGCASLLYLLAIVASQSRGGFVALLALAVLFALRLRHKRSGWMLLGFGLVVLTVLFLAPAAYWDRMATLLARDSGTAGSYDEGGLWSARWTIWQTGLQLVLEHPLLGVGAGAFSVAEGLSHGGLGKWSAPHNSFLQVAGELGLPALVIFVVLIVGAIRTCRRVTAATSESPEGPVAQLASALELSLYTYAVAGFALSQAYAYLLYVLLGLAATLPRLAGMSMVVSPTRRVSVRSVWDLPVSAGPRTGA